MAERKSTLEEQVARARARLDEQHGPGPFDCEFCGINTKHPCVLANSLECQNFGYYPARLRTPSPAQHCNECETQTICTDFPAQRECGAKEGS